MNSLEDQYGWLSAAQAYVSLKHEGDKVIAYERAGLLFVYNFHPTQSFTDYRVGIEVAGQYEIVLSSDDKRFGGFENILLGVKYQTTPLEWNGRKNWIQVGRILLTIGTLWVSDYSYRCISPRERVSFWRGLVRLQSLPSLFKLLRKSPNRPTNLLIPLLRLLSLLLQSTEVPRDQSCLPQGPPMSQSSRLQLPRRGRCYRPNGLQNVAYAFLSFIFRIALQSLSPLL